MNELYSSTSLLHIFFITIVFGCGCAWLAGRAIALTWRPIPMVLGAAVLMGLAVRFVHFALFGEALNAPLTLAIETAILFAVALLAYRRTRARQMVQQYYWLYEASGPLGWRPRQDKPQATV
ncbi:hypothetical protein JQ557_32980 [Bradyrhizobium sp. U87765 SZCCT0131]|uniref:DUF6867 family protein n=1 Tax=unclassified Bradyrhizobium TaxID=2631580 RepID=UPI001BAD5682|nr:MULTISPECIES: hypothetical protein [unclassified Bradyrhizobium]MBR1222856.1 hypothetical protein [Bradyrhizobium sp. U87765 SZCCT0131]MBR1262592.1 hypothetical protein [Bradyrhizobium sp. U87765 SZCCT0134]MBR1308936.1 hypothetical protein [Bradyrhizobium sp. U87765 SZCCT0110]MBR1318374.1 hypothetical protein [Bradyrhizobium sp. U87765 SZCCT0109]MBR1352078.1 hypothetical protein [Bradyrhizobium sp. U87765 SZCCT0048]